MASAVGRKISADIILIETGIKSYLLVQDFLTDIEPSQEDTDGKPLHSVFPGVSVVEARRAPRAYKAGERAYLPHIHACSDRGYGWGRRPHGHTLTLLV